MMATGKTVVLAVVSLFGILAAAATIIVVYGQENSPVLGMLIAFATATVPALLAYKVSEETRQTVESVQHDIRNGVVKDKVKEAIEEVVGGEPDES